MKKALLQAALLIVGGLLIALSVAISPAQASPSSQSALIEHGKYIVSIAGCGDCHTNFGPKYLVDPTTWTADQVQTIAFNAKNALDASKFLAGGRLFDLGPAGKVFSANLTSDVETGLGGWTDEQIKVAIRTGQIPSGRVLVPVMPYHTLNTMADTDLDAVVAYLRTIPPVKNKVPDPTFVTDGLQPLPYTQGITAPSPTDKVARGEYLVKSITSCTDCHTPLDPATGAPMMDKYLSGGQPYEGPWGIVYGGNITPDPETGVGNWTEQEIKVALLTGVNNKGRRLILMPWFVYNSLSTEDADAIAAYIKNGLPAVRNQVPAAAIKEGFTVLAPKTADAPAAFPWMYVIVAVLIIILIIVGLIAFTQKKKTAA